MVITMIAAAEWMDGLVHLAALLSANLMVNIYPSGISNLEMGLEAASTLLSNKGQPA